MMLKLVRSLLCCAGFHAWNYSFVPGTNMTSPWARPTRRACKRCQRVEVFDPLDRDIWKLESDKMSGESDGNGNPNPTTPHPTDGMAVEKFLFQRAEAGPGRPAVRPADEAATALAGGKVTHKKHIIELFDENDAVIAFDVWVDLGNGEEGVDPTTFENEPAEG